MQIRKATLADCSMLMQLGITTFTQAYATQNTEENLNLYLEKAFNEAQLNKELESDSEAYFMIFDHDTAAAYVKLNYNCLPPDADKTDEPMLEIQRIYVLDEYQQKGLGKKLLEIAEAEAQTSNAGSLWLGVWEHNPKAIEFYTKNGFSVTGMHTFLLGEEPQSDFIMMKNL